MNVSLTPEQQAFIDENLRNGRYHTAAEILREGLRLLMDREQLEQRKLDVLRDEIRKGIEAADRGDVRDGESVFRELRDMLRRDAGDERASHGHPSDRKPSSS